MNNPSLPAHWPAPGHLSEGRAFVLKEDVIFTPLGQEGSLCWLNARLPSSGGSFIIATGVSDEEEASATRLLRNEFALREYLSDDWAIRPVASTQYHGRFALVYAPFSFVLLTRIVGAPLACIPSFLELAIRISLPLRLMHLRNLVHGDIKPGNIFIHDDNRCRLGGFGLSSGTAEELQQTRLAVMGGTPAYMSPEHTTRTHRAVDNRSDLYSSGWCSTSCSPAACRLSWAARIRANGRIIILPPNHAPPMRCFPACPPCCRPSSSNCWQKNRRIATRPSMA